jgi:hypothetical protein
MIDEPIVEPEVIPDPKPLPDPEPEEPNKETKDCLPVCDDNLGWILNGITLNLSTVTDLYRVYHAVMANCENHVDPVPKPCEERTKKGCTASLDAMKNECIWIEDKGDDTEHGCIIKPEDCTSEDFSHDESTNSKGPGLCDNNCHCSGKRYCVSGECKDPLPPIDCTSESYDHDEAMNPLGPSLCKTDCQCNGKRTCVNG